MALTLTLEPALVLFGQLDDLCGGVLEGVESRERLQIVSEAESTFNSSSCSRNSSSTAARSRRALARTTSLKRAPCPVAQIRAERVLVIARKALHHLLQVQVIASLVNR